VTEHRTPRDTSDLEALHGQRLSVEEVDLIEDSCGIPAWIKVDREWATVAISPRLLAPPARQEAKPVRVDCQRQEARTGGRHAAS
jgi:hypothetical protein